MTVDPSVAISGSKPVSSVKSHTYILKREREASAYFPVISKSKTPIFLRKIAFSEEAPS